MDLFSTASHFSFKSVKISLASTGDSSEEEALVWKGANLRESEAVSETGWMGKDWEEEEEGGGR